MNAAVRAIVRMGLYVGCKVYLIKEVSVLFNVAVSAGLCMGVIEYFSTSDIFLTNV